MSMYIFFKMFGIVKGLTIGVIIVTRKIVEETKDLLILKTNTYQRLLTLQKRFYRVK